MPKIHRMALVEYSAKKMYDLTNDLSHYPDFVPMCKSIKIHKQTESEAEATMKISQGMITIAFDTHNNMIKDREIKIQLIKGPFKHLSGLWQFINVSDISCRVILDLDFEFSSQFFSLSLGIVFNTVANSMLNAFCKRAKIIYGINSSIVNVK